MKIERVASAVYELGEVDPSWHSEDLRTDFSMSIDFKSHDEQGEQTYPVVDMVDNMYRPLSDFGGMFRMANQEMQLAVEGARKAVEVIDHAVRDFRGYDDRTHTKILTTYRAGLARSTSPFGLYCLAPVLKALRSPITVIPPGVTHVDQTAEEENMQDTVVLSMGGRPTIVYEGPILTGGNGLIGRIFTSYSRLFATNARVLPQNTAVIINRGTTLHRQAAQFRRRSNPSVFLRATIELDKADG